LAKNKFEISTFTTGLVGSPSETDIPDDSAAYSLNINPVAEDGTLTGINNDKVLTSGSGFTTQAKTVQTLLINRGANAASTTMNVDALSAHSDGLVKIESTSAHNLEAGDVIKFTKTGGGAGLDGYLRVNEDLTSDTFTVNLPHADISSTLPTGTPLGTYTIHKDVAGGTQDYKGAFITATTYNSSYEEKKYCFYFQQNNVGADPDLDGFTSVEVDITTTNTAAEIAAALNTKINAQDGLVSSVDTATITISPAVDVKADLINVESTGNSDIPTQDGSYIDIDSGTITSTYTTAGKGTVINVDDMSLINLDKKDFSLFAVDYTNDKIYKWDDVYNTDSKNSLTDFKANLQHNSVSSINQRNKNLFIGLGAGESYKTQWVGKIKKTQISQDLDSWYVVNDGLESIPESASPNNFDHIVSQQIFDNKLAFDEQQCYHASVSGLNSISSGTANLASHLHTAAGKLYSIGDGDDNDVNQYGKTNNSCPNIGWCFKITDTNDTSDGKLLASKQYKYDPSSSLVIGDVFMIVDKGEADNDPTPIIEYIGNAATTEPAFFMAITEGTSYISKISCINGASEFSNHDDRISQIDLADLIEGDTITTISQCRTPVVSGAHSTTLANYMMYGDGTVNDSGHISDQRCRPLHMMYWVGTTSGSLFRVNLMDFHSQHSDTSDDYKGPRIDSKLVLDYSNIGRCQDSQYDGNFKHWYGAIYGAQRFNASHWTNNSNMYIHDKYEDYSTDTPNSSGLWAETYTWSNEPINSNIVGIIETWNNATSDNVPAAAENAVAARYVYDDDSDNAGAGANHYPTAGHMDHHHAQTFGTGTFKSYDADKTLFVRSHSNELNHGFDTGNVITGFIRGDGKGHADYRGNTIVTKVRGLNEFQVQGTHDNSGGNSDYFPYYSCKVWLLWKRKDSSPHQRWDLMLYNFYPTTVQSDSVLVYDRTPAYDECEKNTFSDSSDAVNSFWSNSSGNFYIQKSSQMLGAGSDRYTSDALRDQASSYSKDKWAGPNFVYVMRRDGSSISIMNYYYFTWIGLGNYIGYDGSVTGEPRLMTPFNHSLTTCKPLEELTADYSAIAYNTNPCSGVTSNAASLTWQKGANKHQVYFSANVSGRLAAEGFTGHHKLVDGDSDPFCFRETPFITYNETPMLVKITDTGSAKSDTRTFMGHYESTSNSSAHINQEVPFHYSDGGKFKKRCIYSTTDGTHISTRGSGEDATNLHTLYYTNGTYSLYDGTKLVPDTVPYSNASDASMLQGQIGDYLFIDRKWMSGEPRCGTTQFKRINGYMYVSESEEETANRGGRRQMQMRPYDGGWDEVQTTKIRGTNGYANGNIGWYENDPQNDGGSYTTDGHGFEKKHTGIQLVGVKSDYCITSVGSFYGDEYRHNSSNSTNSGNRYSTTNEVAQLTYDLNRYVPSFEIFGKYACEMRPLEPTSPIDKLRSIHPVANNNISEDNQLFASISSDIGGEYNSSLIAYDNINYSGYDATPFSFSAPNQNILTGKVSSVFDTIKTGYPKIVACPLTPNEDLVNDSPNTFTIWGSGNAQISSVSKQFVAPITGMGYDWGETHFDDFDIDNYISQDPLITFSNEISGGTEFKNGDNVKYKISLLYDGYQESPLSSFFYDKTMSADKSSQDVTLNITQDFVFNPRVTHINVYRKNNDNDLYRLVKEVPLESKLWKNVSGVNKFTFKDSKRFASYSALTGINEENTDTSLNYSISAQINDELFVGLAWHKEVEDDVAKYIYKSKPGNFSQFDYKKDFLVLPAIPTALASFNGKIYAFDRNNTYVINPQQMFIEDTFEGVGCLSQDAFVVTEFGMCFADSNNIYLHNGSAAQPIGNNILDVSTYEGWTIGWQKAAAYSEDTVGIDPFVFYDGPTNSFVCFVHGSCDHNCNPNVSRAWVYSISRNRWDYWEAPKTKKAIQGMDGDIIISDGNLIYNYRDNSTKRDWRWLSKKLSLTKQTGTKRFHKLNLQGSPTLDTISTPPKWNDDIVVYVDGEIQQLTLQTPNVTRNKGFTKEFSGCFLYATLAVDGTTVTLKGLNQGTIGKILPPIGSYILIDEEIMLVTAQPTQQTLTVTRAQLGTAAAVHTYDETTQATEGLEGQRIYIVCPVIKLPSKCKGKNIEVKFENQKATIDSFSIEFIDKGK
jgi:hypothetical protein